MRALIHRRTVISGLLGAGVYGTWAGIANHQAGLGEALRAVGVQSLSSFCMSFVLAAVSEALFRRRVPVVLCALLPPLVGLGVSATAHALSGTPEILATLALPAVVGTTYNSLYVLNLVRLERNDVVA